MDFNNPALQEEFKKFLVTKRDAALAEAEKYNSLLTVDPTPPVHVVATVAEPEPTNEEILFHRKFPLIEHQGKQEMPAEPMTHERIKFFIDKVFNNITGKLPLLGTDKIYERLQTRYPETRSLDLSELLTVLVRETLQNGSYRRYLVGPNKYAYMLSNKSLERGAQIFYNPDVKPGSGNAMFWNIRGAILKHAKDNRVFNGNEFVNKLCRDFSFIKDRDKAKFRTSLNTELSNLTIKGTLERAGESGDRIYYYK